MIRLEITAEAVAWYGAIVASAAAIFSGINLWRDRARVQVGVNPGMSMYPEDPGEEGKTYTLISVSNRGRRPLTVTHVWFELEKDKGQRCLVADSVKGGPREVTEGKAVDYVLKDAPEVDLLAHKYVCVSDATGRTHRRKLVDALPKDKRKLLRRRTTK